MIALLCALILSQAPATTTTTTPPPTTLAATTTTTTKVRLVVLEPQGRGASDDVVKVVGDVVAEELGKRAGDRYDVVSGADARGLLGFEQQKQLLGCSAEDCMKDVSATLNAPFLVTGSLTKVGAGYYLALALYDINRGSVSTRASARADEGGEVLARSVRVAVGDLLLIPATLQLIGQVPGARVYVNDTLVGVTPLEPFPVVGAGEAQVRIEHWDYPPVSTTATLTPGRTTRVTLDLLSYRDIDTRKALRLSSSAVTGALAVAGLGGGAFFASRGWVLNDDYQKSDPRTAQTDLDARAADVSANIGGGYALVGAGAAFAVASTVLFLWDPDADRLAAP